MKKIFNGDLISSGFILGIGASAIEKLPSSAAKTGVQAGLGTVGGYFPSIVNIGMGGYLINKLKGLGK